MPVAATPPNPFNPSGREVTKAKEKTPINRDGTNKDNRPVCISTTPTDILEFSTGGALTGGRGVTSGAGPNRLSSRACVILTNMVTEWCFLYPPPMIFCTGFAYTPTGCFTDRDSARKPYIIFRIYTLEMGSSSYIVFRVQAIDRFKPQRLFSFFDGIVSKPARGHLASGSPARN